MVKTLVMEDEERKPLIVLMHDDRQVSTKDLARQGGTARLARRISPADLVRPLRPTPVDVARS